MPLNCQTTVYRGQHRCGLVMADDDNFGASKHRGLKATRPMFGQASQGRQAHYKVGHLARLSQPLAKQMDSVEKT